MTNEENSLGIENTGTSRFKILDALTSARLKKQYILYVIAVIILLSPVLIEPYQTYVDPFFSKSLPFANFTYEELDAAKWIEKNIPRNYLIYSDPFTVMEFRGLAYRENLPAIGWNYTVMNSVKSVMTSEDVVYSYNKIISDGGENSLIIITSRTPLWLNGTNTFVEIPVNKFESFNGFDKFFDTKYFTLEYRSNNIFVFTPKPQSNFDIVRNSTLQTTFK